MLSRVLVTIDGVWIGNWISIPSQVVTTNNYNTVSEFHTTKQCMLISSVYLP
jgi:hypothetical protein